MNSSLAADALHGFFARQWERQLREDPLGASYIGDPRFNALWPDLRPEARAARQAADRAALDELLAMDCTALSAADQLNHALFRHELEARLAVAPFFPEAYAISAREGPQALNELAEIMPLDDEAGLRTWLQRLQSLPEYLAQYTELLREAAAQGRTQPRSLMQRVLPQLDLQVVSEAHRSPFFAAFVKRPGAVDAATHQALQAQAGQLIAEQIVPAYTRFRDFFIQHYLPRCRETVGIWDTPDGLAYYQNRIAFHTTTDMSAEQVHATGLAEVQRIWREMQAVMDEVGFKGTHQQFFEQLRQDPQHYCESEAELFAAYVMCAKRIEPELPKLFGKLPRTPYGVRPIPATSAPNTTAAYYAGPSDDGLRAGYYYVNLYRPDMRPKYEIEVLTSHEAMPGHHLQIALAQEQQDLPAFRRFSGCNAYLEGWALYSERLGYELGLYQDPYSRFGQLSYDMWRAVRLVLDTGLHAMRWSREQAIDYFRAHAPKTEVDIVNEVDRYIGWPGQALSYKIGQIRVLALRAEAQAALGPSFNLRAFHDMLLEGGAVPLQLLTQRVQAWIAAQQQVMSADAQRERQGSAQLGA